MVGRIKPSIKLRFSTDITSPKLLKTADSFLHQIRGIVGIVFSCERNMGGEIMDLGEQAHAFDTSEGVC
jgi:hypothetical protein